MGGAQREDIAKDCVALDAIAGGGFVGIAAGIEGVTGMIGISVDRVERALYGAG